MTKNEWQVNNNIKVRCGNYFNSLIFAAQLPLINNTLSL